ncbi:hypothetical protein BN439_1422 [Erwinia amylovora Ea644]|uniref:Uncharacterized protein n=3 Tax=Erwinia amylovora TaxID=552 RepID=A0A830ZZV7_ERWAM|nr:hypothetical protein EaACW_1113 [Erwinia amylovora ACW56400]QJQ55179.1 hypothetical protein EHX00_2477 [Erwinia amylovora]CBA20053.1 hypothetical protein predicted by Glimmer/Critica [Erwinia amylovora CFBP1430]CBX79953.1 hypothetical protein predicted by Glimmer/Critica [Erwinia amylovora ATCC BAA-2158]CCO77957.1 hypothetical protein BN432_1137 [Erwinia amylovora Ea356]CCO81744.1 hypothetical protein BN433_1151 [Erwinia amylovora Ea266]CCO85546.1 hypothetical protein BN434_1136 [Erwinia a
MARVVAAVIGPQQREAGCECASGVQNNKIL